LPNIGVENAKKGPIFGKKWKNKSQPVLTYFILLATTKNVFSPNFKC
jgi:hypothetical protein